MIRRYVSEPSQRPSAGALLECEIYNSVVESRRAKTRGAILRFPAGGSVGCGADDDRPTERPTGQKSALLHRSGKSGIGARGDSLPPHSLPSKNQDIVFHPE